MAIFHLSVKVISRSSGRSAVAAAAYRGGERLHDDGFVAVRADAQLCVVAAGQFHRVRVEWAMAVRTDETLSHFGVA